MNDNPNQNPTPEPPPQGGYYVPPQYPQYPPYYSQPQQRNARWWLIPTSLVVGCLPWVILGFIFVGFLVSAAVSGGGGASTSSDHIALIRVGGVITAGKSSSGFLGGTVSGSETLVEQLEKARKNDHAKVIVLRINSPGGSPAGSEEVYNEIRRIRSSGKPVYVSMADVAASGGYYISAAADKIYADTSTLTGSIGVIWDVTDMSTLYKKIGLNPQVVKSGKFKDIGSPDRPLTPDERALLQGIVMDTYDKFVKAVSDGRKIPVADVKKIADGRVFTGNQAIKVKLVDRIGGLRDVTLQAARAGGIKGEPEVIEYGRKGNFFTEVFGDDSEAAATGAEKAVTREIMQRLLEREAAPQGLR